MRFFAYSFLLLLLLLMIDSHKLQCQSSFSLIKTEIELKEIFSGISHGKTDSARLALSLDFLNQLRIALSLEGSADYAWDSLKYVAKIESPDGLFRLYNWNVPLISGGNRYYGLIQFKGSLRKFLPVTLCDHSDTIKEPEYKICDSADWYGALYYKIIPFKMKDKKNAFILLGWDGIDSEIGSKLIEVLVFDKKGVPKFGAPVFPGYLDGKLSRIIFRHSSSTGMSLSYRQQSIPGKPVWNSKKREYETNNKTRLMIVFDHLSPMQPQLEGQYKFYVPASETAEGFIYENFNWKYIGEFDAMNPKIK